MSQELPLLGSASVELAQHVHTFWMDNAAKRGIDLTGFDPNATLSERCNFAKARKLDIAAVLSRFSTQLQQSTKTQVEECIRYAASQGFYVPPEYICVDEGVSGRKSRRAGLDRMRLILQQKLVRALLVYKVSRLFRVAYRGFQFFQEDVVEQGLRAISISQSIDTAEEHTWKQLAYLHGIMDEMLISTIGDHVRSELKTLFAQGYVTGALTVGYQPVPVPGAPSTRLGRPRTVPGVNQDVARLIIQHFEWHRDGMPIKEGWRRWNAVGGPCDPRCKTGRTSYAAYRRMLSNPRYIGCFAFGKKRNRWNSTKDYNVQIPQPETEVVVSQVESLRIVGDELFFAVQQRLTQLKKGPRGPKKRQSIHLWDLVTDIFYCPRCRVRFYQAGANGTGMTCKHSDLCPCKTILRRKQAVLAVCERLSILLQRDADLIERTIARATEIDAAGDESVRADLALVERAVGTLTNKIADLTELLGQGSDYDRALLKDKIRAAQGERDGQLVMKKQLQQLLECSQATITPDRVRSILGDLSRMLNHGAAGNLGSDVVYRAAAVFRLLVGGRVEVHVENRAGRKRKNARGIFHPALIGAIRTELRDHHPLTVPEAPSEEVWLRQPPKRDQLAERVHQLMDIDGLSYREAARALQAEGQNVNSGVVWQIYRRFYEMQGQSVPERAYNNGRPRRLRGSVPD